MSAPGATPLQAAVWRGLLTLVIPLALGAHLEPPAAAAQQSRTLPRIGVLSPFGEADRSFLEAFRQGMKDLGYEEGRTVAIEFRSAEGFDGLTERAAELVRLKVDVIVTTETQAVQATRRATKTIPVVMAGVGDAVDQGLVESLARPGGNITGSSWLNTELTAKRLELLVEALPRVSRVAVLREAAGGSSFVRAAEAAAQSLGVRLRVLAVRGADEFGSAFAAMTEARVGALEVLPSLLFANHRQQVVDLAAKGRLPAIFPDKEFVRAGGLMSYGPNASEMYRRAAAYVDKILKGAKPGELPVEQPTKFELVLNAKTGKALGVNISWTTFMRVDELIK